MAPRILMADDEETFLLATADLLRQEGYEVDTVDNGEDAFEAANTGAYSLLISDIRMAANNDLQLVQRLHEGATGLPVILVTGYPSLKTAVPAVHLSVAAYLIKPVEFELLLRHVRIAIEQFEASRSLRKLQQRARTWSEELEALRGAGASFRPPSTQAVAGFTELTLANIAGSLDDLRRLITALGQPAAVAATPCVLLNCPRHTVQAQAIEDAIDVLEATKGAFKSKQLADLRRRLEEVRDGTAASRARPDAGGAPAGMSVAGSRHDR